MVFSCPWKEKRKKDRDEITSDFFKWNAVGLLNSNRQEGRENTRLQAPLQTAIPFDSTTTTR